MGVATDLSGRLIKFSFGQDEAFVLPEIEFEIINGSVSETVDEQYFLPVGHRVKNVIGHGHTITITFQGVLLIKDYPWRYLKGNTEIYGLSVVLNREGTSTEDDYYDEIDHYSDVALVTKITHDFSTDTHQTFNITIVCDGSYYPPGSTSDIDPVY